MRMADVQGRIVFSESIGGKAGCAPPDQKVHGPELALE